MSPDKQASERLMVRFCTMCLLYVKMDQGRHMHNGLTQQETNKAHLKITFFSAFFSTMMPVITD